MIKEIYFQNTKTFKENIITFSQGNNVIIGPKGGGKSTLFNLVASLEKKYITESTINALKSFGLKFEKAQLFSGESISINNLEIKKFGKSENPYIGRDDVISQDDPIKTRLDDDSFVQKNLFKWTKKVVSSSQDVNKLIQLIENFYNSLFTFSNYIENGNKLNWGNTFTINSLESNPLTILYKDPFNGNKNITQLELLYDNLESWQNTYRGFHDKLETRSFAMTSSPLLSKTYQEKKLKHFDIIKKELKSLEEITKVEMSSLTKTKTMFQAFSYSYQNMLDNIKKSDKKNNAMLQFHEEAKSHFKLIAENINLVKFCFKPLLAQDYVLRFDNTEGADDILQYKVAEEFSLRHDKIIKILQLSLTVPKSSNSPEKWIEVLMKKGPKKAGFNRDKIINHISNWIIHEQAAHVAADGKNYHQLSLGEKSIFGIEHKFNVSKSDNVYLDQVEDNLDNYTVATKIVQLIKNKVGQKFIVTHNPNVGVLTGVNEVIIADKDDLDNGPYYKGVISNIKSNNTESHLAHYLEGGTISVKKRLQIIEGENNGN